MPAVGSGDRVPGTTDCTPKTWLNRGAVIAGVVALVALVALIVLFAAPQVLAVGFIAATVTFLGGVGNLYIALGVIAGVTMAAGAGLRHAAQRAG
jgi:hypothetical protein